MPTLPLSIRALTVTVLSGALCVAAQADTLVDIYELALENDAQLKTQIAQYNADIELEKLALAPLLPQARAGYSFTDSENDSTRPNVIFNDDPLNPGFQQIDVTSVTETETDGYDVSLSQTLFDLSAWFGWRAGKEQTQRAEANLSAAQQDLIVRVVQAYFGVLRAQDNLRASQAQERAFERQLEQTRQRFEVGLIAITALSIFLAVKGIYDQRDLIVEQFSNGWDMVQVWLAEQGISLNSVDQAVQTLGAGATSGAGGLVQAGLSSVFSFIVGLLIGVFLLFYVLKDWHVIRDWVANHLGQIPPDLGAGIINDATRAIRSYFAGLAITAFPVAIIIGIAMLILDIPLAFTVILVTFVTSFIPYLGAIVSGAFAVLVALGAAGVQEAIIILIRSHDENSKTLRDFV